MQIISEKGRSMVEMLGVLAVIGVLTVGSLSIVGKARQQFTITQIISEATTLIDSAIKMSCDFEPCGDGEVGYCYKSYTQMLHRSGTYPASVRAIKSTSPDAEEIKETSGDEAKAFLLTSDTVMELNASGNGFEVVLSNIPDEACVAVATADWDAAGNLISASFGTGSSNAKIIELDAAATACSAASPKLTLKFKGCRRAQ